MTSDHPTPVESEALPSGRQAGAAIIIASLLSVVLMALHPHYESRTAADFIEESSRKALVNGVIHGGLIALIGVLVSGLSCFASRLGPGSAAVRAGLVAYVMGAAAMMAAALVSGLIIPEFVSEFEGRPNEELAMMRLGIALCHAANQVCSRMGVLAMAVAIALWSAELARRPGGPRVAGVLGLVTAAGLALALLTGHLRMNIHGVGAFLIGQTVWCVAVALLLIRGRI